MLHEPAAQSEKDYGSEYKKSLGIKMFIIYGVLYAGFVIINALFPGIMQTKVIFGLNLAVSYGFGLILFAIISGLIYNKVCSIKENQLRQEDEGASK